MKSWKVTIRYVCSDGSLGQDEHIVAGPDTMTKAMQLAEKQWLGTATALRLRGADITLLGGTTIVAQEVATA